VTDAQGRYRLLGMPKGEKNRIRAVPDGDQPYLVSLKLVPDSPGLDPVQADVELRRGVWIEGRIMDKATGKPVRQNVNYFAHPDNPNLDSYGYDPDGTNRAATSEDGSYRLAGMPGPGLVAVGVEDGYLRANERDDEFGVKEIFIRTIPIPTLNYSAFARIDPTRGMESVGRDITLDPGWTFTGTVLGPDGKPLAGAWGLGLSPRTDLEALKTAEFTVSQFNPRQPRLLLFQHPRKGLVGVARPPEHRGDSITVQLQPGATIKGRIVDADGRARPGMDLSIWRHRDGRAQPMESDYFPLGRNKTDQQGRFSINGLLPGYEFALDAGNGGYLPLGEGLRSGQTKDLGDVTIGDE
jgi:protocatechuate 3,4-dioxygenase beta subunit